MELIIYGRDNCPYTEDAKTLAEMISEKDNHIRYRYYDWEDMPKKHKFYIQKRQHNTKPAIFIKPNKHTTIFVGGYKEFLTLHQQLT